MSYRSDSYVFHIATRSPVLPLSSLNQVAVKLLLIERFILRRCAAKCAVSLERICGIAAIFAIRVAGLRAVWIEAKPLIQHVLSGVALSSTLDPSRRSPPCCSARAFRMMSRRGEDPSGKGSQGGTWTFVTLTY